LLERRKSSPQSLAWRLGVQQLSSDWREAVSLPAPNRARRCASRELSLIGCVVACEQDERGVVRLAWQPSQRTRTSSWPCRVWVLFAHGTQSALLNLQCWRCVSFLRHDASFTLDSSSTTASWARQQGAAGNRPTALALIDVGTGGFSRTSPGAFALPGPGHLVDSVGRKRKRRAMAHSLGL